jgi:hypothetical protein
MSIFTSHLVSPEQHVIRKKIANTKDVPFGERAPVKVNFVITFMGSNQG